MPEAVTSVPVSRRTVLRAAGIGGAALFAAGMSACGKSRSKSATAPPHASTSGSSVSGSTTAGSTAGIAPITPPPPPRQVPSPSKVHDVRTFGAIGDGHSDDAAAIQRGLSSLQTGEALQFPAGKVFNHSAVLTVSTPGVHLVGTGTLNAMVESTSALKIDAANVVVDGLTLAVAHTTQRWSTPDQHKLYLGPHDGISVRGVTITGSAAAGLFCFGSTNFELLNVTVSDTRADGIHMTYGAQDGNVVAPQINRSGDDGVAVVSYLNDKTACARISITQPQVRTTTGGRGISVVGGQDVSYSDIAIDGSNAASVYISCEGSPSFTFPTTRVQVVGGTITNANTNSSIDHGAVLIYSGRDGGDVTDIVVSGLTISGTRPGASRQIGVVADHGYPVSAVVFSDLTLAADPTPYQGNAPAQAFSLRAVTAAGKPVTA